MLWDLGFHGIYFTSLPRFHSNRQARKARHESILRIFAPFVLLVKYIKRTERLDMPRPGTSEPLRLKGTGLDR